MLFRSVDNKVDTRSGTVRLRARFDNAQGELIPGQFAKMRLGRAKATEALLISDRAVGTDQNKKFVIVVDNDNKAVYREVTLGPIVGGLRIVTSGLKPNERILISGLQRVKPGTMVEPQEASMVAQPDPAGRAAATERS